MFYEVSKRLLDIAIALISIVLFSPIMLLVALAIKLYDGGPIFDDAPLRIGKGGKLFNMYKFRSMVVNAHEKIKTDPAFKDILAKWENNQGKLKIEEDPRVTPIGRIIRRTDLDELPQFFNIIKNEMSVVGPRPFFEEEVVTSAKRYPQIKKYMKIISSVKPGITGPWQTSGRNNFSLLERFKIDAQYAGRKSFLYDVYIILKTPFVIISRLGVYE